VGAIAAFLLGPVLARAVVHIPYEPTLVLVFIAASLLGAAFPLLAHLTVRPGDGAGQAISYLYLSNIIGSTLGSFLIGFVVLDMGMPEMNGAEVFRALRQRSNVPILIATGYAVEEELQRLVATGARVIEKPYKLAALEAEVERALGRPDHSRQVAQRSA